MIKERLEKLRNAMKMEKVNCCLIPTSDYHDSEYVSDFFAVRRYFSGFTGSAGTLVVTESESALFTDGRYFIQAAKELEGTEIQLMKMGEPQVPSLKEYLEKVLQEGQTLGFDGRVISAKRAESYEKILQKKQGKIVWDMDPAEGIWEDRPHLPGNPVYILEECYSGESVEKKIERVRGQMREKEADVHILTALDDIAWLFNLRGSDVDYCPVFLSYAVIRMDEVILFADKSEVSLYLKENNVTMRPYRDIYDYVSGLHGEKVLISRERTNYRLYKSLAEDMIVIDEPNPTALMKAVKNATEMENLRKAHLKDAVAVTKFMFWLKNNVGQIPMTEISAGEYLEGLRREQVGFQDLSFQTICAYGANGAIIHYSAREEDCAEIKPQGLLMVDSGGHYLEGSTDITRTFVLGPVTDEMKHHFTLVLRSMLCLANTRFLYGCRGSNLDIRAREVFWEQGLDYKHGTGHGVGYLLNVHEGPNSFRWKIDDDIPNCAVMEEGMVTTDEPGIYIEGSHGIRLENELLCRKAEKNEFGQFMCFENLTWVPIDLDGVAIDQLTSQERKWLNDYHRQVCEKLSPYFEGRELAWLEDATREI